MIFVFGSNLAGRHGLGAAKYAKEIYGAQPGVGYGPTGMAYAIPTKDRNLKKMERSDILPYVLRFVLYTMEHPDTDFLVTRIGCGLAGNKDSDMATMFNLCGRNCIMPIQWKPFLSGIYRWHNEGDLLY